MTSTVAVDYIDLCFRLCQPFFRNFNEQNYFALILVARSKSKIGAAFGL